MAIKGTRKVTCSVCSAALRLFVTCKNETGYFWLLQGVQRSIRILTGNQMSLDPNEEHQPVLHVNWDGLEAESCIYMICSATDAQQSNANSVIF